MKKNFLFIIACASICGATVVSCGNGEKQSQKVPVDTLKEGVDYEIAPDSLPFTNSEGQPDFWYPSNAGDTIWLRGPKARGASDGSKHYESDPMWREVQRHVDNDPYFKQW